MTEPSESPYGPDRERQLAHLASSVGHYVINAFSAVVSNAEILKLADPIARDPELADSAEIIVNVAVKASGIARRLIDFSRPSTEPAPHRVELKPLLDEVVAEMADAAPEVAWAAEYAELPPIRGDADQLRAMFRYLLLNAIEAVRPPGGRIALRARLEQPDWVHLLIEDNGSGMDAMVHEQALEPFFSTKPGRLGLGLCLANSIWRRHGGTLSITSRSGQGTTLRLAYSPAR